MHLRMLADARERGDTDEAPYGTHWGDPAEKPHLGIVRDVWCAPFVKPTSAVLEIGPGGGRWTRYLLGCGTLYAVDVHPEMLDELRRNFVVPHLRTVAGHGDDLPGIPDDSIDFVFSFGTFVHLELAAIEGYLKEIMRVLKLGGDAVIQYSDKSKPQAARNEGFTDNTPSRMRRMVMDRGFLILAENLTLLPHSGLIRFTRTSQQQLLDYQTCTSS